MPLPERQESRPDDGIYPQRRFLHGARGGYVYRLFFYCLWEQVGTQIYFKVSPIVYRLFTGGLWGYTPGLRIVVLPVIPSVGNTEKQITLTMILDQGFFAACLPSLCTLYLADSTIKRFNYLLGRNSSLKVELLRGAGAWTRGRFVMKIQRENSVLKTYDIYGLE